MRGRTAPTECTMARLARTPPGRSLTAAATTDMDHQSYEQSLEWRRKGATLSDKNACREFGLTQDEIYDAIDTGALQYRQAAMHGNPWLRLLRQRTAVPRRADAH